MMRGQNEAMADEQQTTSNKVEAECQVLRSSHDDILSQTPSNRKRVVASLQSSFDSLLHS